MNFYNLDKVEEMLDSLMRAVKACEGEYYVLPILSCPKLEEIENWWELYKHEKEKKEQATLLKSAMNKLSPEEFQSLIEEAINIHKNIDNTPS